MSMEAQYYCAKCGKRVDATLLTAGKYRIGKYLYCTSCYKEEEKGMRLVRGYQPNFDKLMESIPYVYRGLECVVMRFTNKENDNWAAGFFPRRFVSEVMGPFWKMRLFSEETCEPITGYLEREEISPKVAVKRMKGILKETIDKILDGHYYFELMNKMNAAGDIVRRWEANK